MPTDTTFHSTFPTTLLSKSRVRPSFSALPYEQFRTNSTVLDAWLKDEDDAGWKLGPNVKVPAVSLLVRKGNPGFNSNEAEATFASRPESSWPIARTRYTKYYLNLRDLSLSTAPTASAEGNLELQGLGKGKPVQFPVTFEEETEIAGHVVANLVMGVGKRGDGTAPKDLDVFVTVRHIGPDGKEVFYTGMSLRS